MSQDDKNAVFVANTTFATVYEGATHIINRGTTRVRGDHPIRAANPSYFDAVDLEVHYDTPRDEDASADPGTKRGAPQQTVIQHDAGPSSEALAAQETRTEGEPTSGGAPSAGQPKAAEKKPAAAVKKPAASK